MNSPQINLNPAGMQQYWKLVADCKTAFDAAPFDYSARSAKLMPNDTIQKNSQASIPLFKAYAILAEYGSQHPECVEAHEQVQRLLPAIAEPATIAGLLQDMGVTGITPNKLTYGDIEYAVGNVMQTISFMKDAEEVQRVTQQYKEAAIEAIQNIPETTVSKETKAQLIEKMKIAFRDMAANIEVDIDLFVPAHLREKIAQITKHNEQVFQEHGLFQPPPEIVDAEKIQPTEPKRIEEGL